MGTQRLLCRLRAARGRHRHARRSHPGAGTGAGPDCNGGLGSDDGIGGRTRLRAAIDSEIGRASGGGTATLTDPDTPQLEAARRVEPTDETTAIELKRAFE
ncbi:hypothetical protein [Natrinema sp. 1APR25-10V2]|uniref:hypothetical protein n=1 Tax=Natrinema sp. 1APR25-10V2 TaxID=2951081 RepID=UPI0028746C97|nr:hypothetical protein [Natrinema sp. 1APR25-10V2]MDS0473930.1 hypothetical protein [Natrinema sp. 1APR25-10V2]